MLLCVDAGQCNHGKVGISLSEEAQITNNGVGNAKAALAVECCRIGQGSVTARVDNTLLPILAAMYFGNIHCQYYMGKIGTKVPRLPILAAIQYWPILKGLLPCNANCT